LSALKSIFRADIHFCKTARADSEFSAMESVAMVDKIWGEGDSMRRTSQGGDMSGQVLELVRKRLSIALWLSVAMIVVYFGFMGLFAFNKPLLGTILAPGLSVCILLGPAVIVTSFVLCLIYVLWANRVYDPGVRNLAR
jgi:uncharacterized membrane protein (DUF485 family)